MLVERRDLERDERDFHEEFWPVQLRKVGKSAALVEWRKTRGVRPATAELVARYQEQARSPRYRAGAVPDPRTWLHQRRWEDDPAALTWGERTNGSPVDRHEAALERENRAILGDQYDRYYGG